VRGGDLGDFLKTPIISILEKYGAAVMSSYQPKNWFGLAVGQKDSNGTFWIRFDHVRTCGEALSVMMYTALTRQPSLVSCLYKQSATPTVIFLSGIDLLIVSGAA
jgi:hypothetical protein